MVIVMLIYTLPSGFTAPLYYKPFDSDDVNSILRIHILTGLKTFQSFTYCWNAVSKLLACSSIQQLFSYSWLQFWYPEKSGKACCCSLVKVQKCFFPFFPFGEEKKYIFILNLIGSKGQVLSRYDTIHFVHFCQK